jgi:GAG-pre-integrase domain
MKMGHDALRTAEYVSGSAKKRIRDPTMSVPSKMSSGAQNMKTGPDALCIAENESDSAKHENGTRAQKMNGLYMLEINKPVFNINKRLKTSHENMTFMWHCRFGHINKKHIKKLHEVGFLGNFNIETINACKSCLRGKMTKELFSKKGQRTSDLLALIHTDVCGPMSTYTRNSDRYFITFTDDYSRYGYVYFMRHKSESFEKFKEFRTEVENQLNNSIKALRLDREGKYLCYEFIMYLKKM